MTASREPRASQTPVTPGARDAEYAEDAELAARLRVALGRLNRLLLQQHSGSDEASFAQLSAMFVIEKWGPIRIGDLAQRERVAAPSMTRTLSGLVTAGWVQRVPDPEDGRSSMVSMTPGRAGADQRGPQGAHRVPGAGDGRARRGPAGAAARRRAGAGAVGRPGHAGDPAR